MIRGSHKRTRFHMGEAHGLSGPGQPVEFIGRVIALYWQVSLRWRKVLADCQYLTPCRRDLSHTVQQLIPVLTNTDHDAGFHDGRINARPGAAENLKRPFQSGAWPNLRVEPRNCLDIVIEHVRARLQDTLQSLEIAVKVWNEDLDSDATVTGAQLADRLGENPGTAIGKIIAVDGRNHDLLQPQGRHPFGHPSRLIEI